MSYSEGADQPDAETLLRRVVEVISNAKSLLLPPAPQVRSMNRGSNKSMRSRRAYRFVTPSRV